PTLSAHEQRQRPFDQPQGGNRVVDCPAWKLRAGRKEGQDVRQSPAPPDRPRSLLWPRALAWPCGHVFFGWPCTPATTRVLAPSLQGGRNGRRKESSGRSGTPPAQDQAGQRPAQGPARLLRREDATRRVLPPASGQVVRSVPRRGRRKSQGR